MNESSRRQTGSEAVKDYSKQFERPRARNACLTRKWHKFMVALAKPHIWYRFWSLHSLLAGAPAIS